MENFNKKQYEKFFGGGVSEYFDGHKNLYLGDKDFIFADPANGLHPGTNITAEIKKVGATGFDGKKLSMNQAREYSSTVGLIDNLGRTMLSYLFEYHPEVRDPYVIVIPFLPAKGDEKEVKQYLDLNNSKMLYVIKYEQFGKWLSGDRYVGTKPTKDLLCV